jgi:DNA adenine methylase
MKEVPTLVKWAGGKKQLLEQFKSIFPKSINGYLEPFVGGGAVAFFILKYYNPKKVRLSDINENLINVYNIIKQEPNKLIKALKKLVKKNDERSFYKLRNKKFNDKVKEAARFIYLNKTCFNGLYRVNNKGEFNVPFGNYSNPAILMEEDLRQISELLKDTDIANTKFEDILNYAKKGDFIYLDPPYYPIKKESFTKYSRGNFLEKEQKDLAKVFVDLDNRGCLIMLSNSDTEFIKDLYKNFKIHIVQARRMINSNAKKRGKINEVVITNY